MSLKLKLKPQSLNFNFNKIKRAIAMAIATVSEEDEHKKHVNGDKDEDCSSKFVEVELEVANILVELSSLISIKKRKSVVNCSFEFEYNWGMTKRRSAVVNPPKFEIKIREQIVHSPNTPLSFPTSASASASDSTPKKKTPPLLLRKRELKKAVEERLQTQQQLKESIGKVKEYLKKIKADNSALKAQKRKLIVGEKGEEKGAMTEGGSSKQEAHKPWINPDYYHIHEASTSTQLNQQPPLIYPCHHHHYVYAGQWPLQFHYHHQPYPMLQFQQQQQKTIKQIVEIDLNITPSPTPEDEQMIRRLEAQEARKNRLRVNKEKRTRAIITT